jgi:hypothetical protein
MPPPQWSPFTPALTSLRDLTDFVGRGAFIVGRPGSYEDAIVNDWKTNSSEGEEVHSGPEQTYDMGLDEDLEQLEPWSITALDAAEESLVALVVANQVDEREPEFAHGVETCDYCGCDLSRRGVFVDGRLRDDLMWGNMCAACFAKLAEGIGWGKGQLYARQPNGDWRLVAGFEPELPESPSVVVRRTDYIPDPSTPPNSREHSAVRDRLRQDLRRKVGYGESKIDRLFDQERQKRPDASEVELMQAAIDKWEKDNR